MRFLNHPFLCAFVLVIAAGCSRAPTFESYDDPSGDFRLEIPKNWQAWGNAKKGQKPISAVMFVGKQVSQEEGIPMGAVLSVTKFYRRRGDYPGKDASYERFRKDVLVPSGVLFGDSPSKLPTELRKLLPSDIKDASFSGHPAKIYERRYEQNSGSSPVPMRLQDVVIQTPEAYFVIEYRATDDLFERYRFALEHARETFKLRP